ncbi:MAG: tRNA uridine-5-carboxymethylaminomethyl(34) synthesis GTPase MnmE [Candidatus Methylacidiphilales bacterium]
MSSLHGDTIVAAGTPSGISALALVRVSGPGSLDLLRRHFPSAPVPPEPRRAYYGWFVDGAGNRLDDGVAVFWRGPRSYTGEDVVEFSCHGNPLIVDRVMAALIGSGARLARPGEFTQRAFENGKLDLTQAEAVMDLISAQSDRALRMAGRARAGSLSRAVAGLQQRLLNHLAHVEAFIDFPDEDLSPEVGESLKAGLEEIVAECRKLLATAREGRLLRQGAVVVLAGAPNAGKSSLLNALLQESRAIVSPEPGTTRDTIDAVVVWEGIPVRLVDTAGLRESADLVEREGVERSRAAVAGADVVIWVEDGRMEGSLNLGEIPEGVPVIRCRTRADLAEYVSGEGLAISSVSGTGLPELRRALMEALCVNGDGGEALVALNRRQEEVVRRATEQIEAGLRELAEGLPPELVATSLRGAQQAFGELVGMQSCEDVLDRLFESFCIGK